MLLDHTWYRSIASFVYFHFRKKRCFLKVNTDHLAYPFLYQLVLTDSVLSMIAAQTQRGHDTKWKYRNGNLTLINRCLPNVLYCFSNYERKHCSGLSSKRILSTNGKIILWRLWKYWVFSSERYIYPCIILIKALRHTTLEHKHI